MSEGYNRSLNSLKSMELVELIRSCFTILSILWHRYHLLQLNDGMVIRPA